MVLKSGFRHRSSQITSMLRWLSISSRRLDRTHIEAFVAQFGQEIRADLLAMLSGRQKFFIHRDAISDR